MKIYFAGSCLRTDWPKKLEELRINSGLVSYYDILRFKSKLGEFEYFKARDMFLDSGAYSAFTKNVDIDIDKYIKFIKQHQIKLYANLDVIGDAEATLKNQEYMETCGLTPIPCYHIHEILKYLKHYLSKYQYVAIGGVAGNPNTRSCKVFLDTCFREIRNNFPIKIHGFGITGFYNLKRYPFYSVDSSSAIMGGGLGRVNIFHNGKMTNGSYKNPQIGGRVFNCVDNGATQHMNRRINNIKHFKRMEKYITELWTARGITWES